jgi:hypothetical protein
VDAGGIFCGRGRCSWRCVWLRGRVGKNTFVENNMPGDYDTSCGEIKTTIALLFSWIAKEDTTSRPRMKFVMSGSIEVGIAQTSKCAEMGVCGVSTKEAMIRCVVVNCARGAYVDEVICSVECLNPKSRGKVCLNKKGSDNVIGGAQHAFGFSILRRSMRTRETK